MTCTNYPHDILAGGSCVYKSAAYTVVAVTDSGKIFYSDVDGMVFTLPAIASGECYTFVNSAEAGAAKMSISPNADDGIMYATDYTNDKDLINTKATHVQGDRVTVYNISDADYWQVGRVQGVWAKEP